MITIDKVYDEIAYHAKDAAKMPYTYDTMTIDQQLLFRDLFDSIMHNVGEQEELLEDLNLIKSDLEAVIANVKK